MEKTVQNIEVVTGDFKRLMSCYPSNEENFLFLMRLIQRNVVAPFLGAGFSANFGYPTWRRFLEKQAKHYHLDEINQVLKKQEYEKAASLLKKRLGGGMEYVLIKNFESSNYKITDKERELENLSKIFRSLVLTTNFDESIEMLYAKVNGEYIEKFTPHSLKDIKLIHKRLAFGEPTLIKLHGDVAKREFVLTEEAYNEVYGEHILDVRLPLPSFLRDVLLSRVILFLGCSLDEDRTLHVIEQSRIDGSISFALLPLPEKTKNINNAWEPKFTNEDTNEEISEFLERMNFLSMHNIIPIWYPTGKGEEALKIFLGEIAMRISSEYKLSMTKAHDRVSKILEDVNKIEKTGDIQKAFHNYANAVEIMKNNPDAFLNIDRLKKLNSVETFYRKHGYILEIKEIMDEIIKATRQAYSENSVELALCYHEIGYIYEKYQYYTLMLKAMQKSKDILKKCQKENPNSESVVNASAMIYTSLAYVYVKKKMEEEAKVWYKEAEVILNDPSISQLLCQREKAFLCNGLHRYYYMLGQNEKALEMLDEALKIRRRISHNRSLDDSKTRDASIHVINTHSNKIYIYLNEGRYEDAEREYEDYRNEYDRLSQGMEVQDGERRILTCHGDLLMTCEKYEEAYSEYQKALQCRRYLNFSEDFLVAELYQKMGDSLQKRYEWERQPKEAERALEYQIQSYVIYKQLQIDSVDLDEMYTKILSFGEQLSYPLDILEQRILMQRDFFRYRHNKRMDNQEQELIEYFRLE